MMKNRSLGPKRSLLSKTFRTYAFCVLLCFVVTMPLFYLLTKHYYAEDLIELVEAVQQGKDIPSIDLEQDVMGGMMLQFLLIFAAIAVSLFLTLQLVTQKLWQPFDDTLRKAEQFHLAKSEVPEFGASDVEEFERLNHTLARLMRKDKETYRIQKEFTENASHELQTPLAIIRSKLDLLMQEHLDQRQMQLVADLYGMTIRLGHLNTNLLLLAKIDNAQYTTFEQLDLMQCLQSSLPLYDSLRGAATLSLHDGRSPHGASGRLRANPVLLDCLLKNLIVNAIRHSPPKGNVAIRVADGSLTVSNMAVGAQPLPAETLFRRFHSTDAAHKGNGLGLAIAKAICDYHHWTIAYHYAVGEHRFVVSFPSADA